MLALGRVAIVAAFVGAMAFGTGLSYADEEDDVTIRETTGRGGGAFEIAELLARYVKYRAGIIYNDFVRKYCVEDDYRKSVLINIMGYVPNKPSWLPDWLVPRFVKDEKELDNLISGHVNCDGDVLTRLYVIQKNVAELKKIIDDVKRWMPGESKPGAEFSAFEASITSIEKKIQALEISVAEINSTLGNVSRNVMQLKNDVSRVEREIAERPPLRAVRPKYVRSRQPLVPCACKSPETETNVWLNAWRSSF
jgi:hypothetical protein